jgi:hypothetical protein
MNSRTNGSSHLRKTMIFQFADEVEGTTEVDADAIRAEVDVALLRGPVLADPSH